MGTFARMSVSLDLDQAVKKLAAEQVLQKELTYETIEGKSRLERLSAAKRKSREVARVIAAEGQHTGCEETLLLAEQIRLCGVHLWFRFYYQVNETRLTHAIFCKRSMLCQLCAIRRAVVMANKYRERWQEVQKELKSVQLFHVVLTVKNGEDVNERFDHLSQSIRKTLVAARLAKGRGHSNVFEDLLGAIISREVTIGRDGFHPHAHLLCAVKEGGTVDPERLSKAWHKTTRDSFIVHSEPVYGQSEDSAFLETFKYQLKFSGLDAETVWDTWKNLKSRRMLSSTGVFHGLKAPEVITDPLLAADEPFIETMVSYFNGQYDRQERLHSTDAGKLKPRQSKGFNMVTKKRLTWHGKDRMLRRIAETHRKLDGITKPF